MELCIEALYAERLRKSLERRHWIDGGGEIEIDRGTNVVVGGERHRPDEREINPARGCELDDPLRHLEGALVFLTFHQRCSLTA